MIGAARIVVAGDGLYRADASGKWAAVVPVYGSDNELGDLCAWFVDKPSHWWLRFGGEPILGALNIARAAWEGEPLHLFPTPQAWAIGQGRGFCVLRWGVPLHDILDGIPSIACDSLWLKRRLLKALRQSEPKVSVETRHAA